MLFDSKGRQVTLKEGKCHPEFTFYFTVKAQALTKNYFKIK